VWDVEALTAGESKAKQVHSKNGLASPTPIVAGDRIYVHFGHMGSAALDTTGKVVWRQTEVDYAPVHGGGGSPAIVDDLLVFNCDGGEGPFLAALDRATGEVRWKTERRSPAKKSFSFSTPLVTELLGRRQVISAASGLVAGYDPHDGHELWRVRYGEGYSVIPRPVIAQGLLFACSGFDKSNLYAIKLPDRDGDLTETHIAWQYSKGVPHTPSIVANGDEIFFVSDAGIASCLDAQSGKVHWSERLGGGFSASPIVAENRVYFLSEQGVCHVVKADTTFERLSTNELGERTFASPAAIDGALVLRSESHLWRIAE
jgi:outer membrane protein assembly factor BamB